MSQQATQYTHFHYICRVCQQEAYQKINQENPDATETPKCCRFAPGRGGTHMAYKGPVTLNMTTTPPAEA